MSRVELGDNPVWIDCRHKELQIPTNWSKDGNLIDITVNQGTFIEGDTAYLFIIDSNGAVSSGYPITIGEEGERQSILPVPPTNLKIQ